MTCGYGGPAAVAFSTSKTQSNGDPWYEAVGNKEPQEEGAAVTPVDADISSFLFRSGKSFITSVALDLKEVSETPWIPALFLTQ